MTRVIHSGERMGVRTPCCTRNGAKWVMAVYFPRGQQSFAVVKKKFIDDIQGVRQNKAGGIVFVTNQELTLAERSILAESAEGFQLELYHLERLSAVIDSPILASTRKQFLEIDYLEDSSKQIARIQEDILAQQKRLDGVHTCGNSFCYFMLYYFDMKLAIAQQLVIIRQGEFPLYDLRIRVMDIDANRNVFKTNWGELNSPADFLPSRWSLPLAAYYRIFFHARNGAWHQDLILLRSETAKCWLAATRVLGCNGRDVTLMHIDNDFKQEFGDPTWRG